MNRLGWFLLGLSSLAFVAVAAISNVSPQAESFSTFTPPGRIALASPGPVALRGENGLPVTVVNPPASDTAVSTPPSTKAVTKTTLQPTAAKTAPKPTPKPTTTATPAPASCSGSFSQTFICLLNQYRTSKGLGTVSYNSSLTAVALKHSAWMNSTGIFSHEESDGSHLLDRCRAAGIICRGENLARGATSPQNLLNMWIASPEHNAILLGRYTTAGLGISGAYITLLMN